MKRKKKKKDPKKKQLQLIRTRLRQTWMWGWQRSEAIKSVREIRDGVYKCPCNECGEWFRQTEVDVDHTIPCGTLNYTNMGAWVKRLFCPPSKLQILCKPCHKEKK